MAGNGGGKAPVWTSAFVWQVLTTVVAAVITAMGTIQTAKEQMRAESAAKITELRQEMLAVRAEDAKHTLSREEFLEERSKQRDEENQHYNQLLLQIDRLQRTVRR